MAERNRTDDAVVGKIAVEVVYRLSAQLAEATASIQGTLEREIVELRGDVQLLDLLHASVEGNVAAVLNAIHYDIPIERVESPTAALEYARRLAQRGVPVNALVRAYRLGHKEMLERIIDGVQEAGADPALSLDVFNRISEVTFNYIDWISQQVVAAYEAERDRWLENRSRVRNVRIAEILDGGDIDTDAMTKSIRYPLRKVHLALVLWFPDDATDGNEFERLERFLDELAEHLGTGNALFVAADRITGWGWIPLRANDAGLTGRVRRFVAGHTDAPHVALGQALPGVEGFRRAHRQARNAHRVGVAVGASAPAVMAVSDEGLSAAALMGADLPDAGAWVRETLGPLSTDSDNDAVLRETLRVFLREGGSYKAAAERLHLHYNSVKYRVARAVERRGRPIDDERLDVEMALLVCQWFGAVVLGPER
ncbi:helix-turn-helix domain-containing protein [Mycobacterium ulcerans]|uniref:Helix-turn-helix domain-containing protein n=1 Tax=Mycobacterium ulcerans TaxID=1809 RepID=A0ABY3VGK2_MYCUL|nr:helix-turn-helix domain-containing protein [Mycobacterium ulcerans]UDM35875.1 helix-turn-helix domain-containing protein [Mycobacterium ulcerans]ULP53161.1 helix-turn-helix domain-containing protein [Mycobacterium ulcerans]